MNRHYIIYDILYKQPLSYCIWTLYIEMRSSQTCKQEILLFLSVHLLCINSHLIFCLKAVNLLDNTILSLNWLLSAKGVLMIQTHWSRRKIFHLLGNNTRDVFTNNSMVRNQYRTSNKAFKLRYTTEIINKG